MDAIDLLVSQHRAMEALTEQAIKATGDGERLALFNRVADELTTHVASEEQVFYPAVKARRTEDILLESLEEHLSLKRLVADLLALQPSDQTFEPKFKVLKEQMEHHHKEEEEHLFPKARQLLDDARRVDLGSEMLALQKSLQRQGEPREAMSDQTESAAPL